jgi:hypothetical protein
LNQLGDFRGFVIHTMLDLQLVHLSLNNCFANALPLDDQSDAKCTQLLWSTILVLRMVVSNLLIAWKSSSPPVDPFRALTPAIAHQQTLTIQLWHEQAEQS